MSLLQSNWPICVLGTCITDAGPTLAVPRGRATCMMPAFWPTLVIHWLTCKSPRILIGIALALAYPVFLVYNSSLFRLLVGQKYTLTVGCLFVMFTLLACDICPQ